MNALAVLEYGHQTVLQSVDNLPEAAWQTPNVCGVWSIKEIVAHLSSFEWVLAEVLASLTGGEPTPTLDQFRDPQGRFNDAQVVMRGKNTVTEQLGEYVDAHARVMTLAEQMNSSTFSQPGLLPWYGEEYSLDDFIVYAFYGHKREHSAQIALFRKHAGY